jgi:hypothetical protein
MVEFVFISEAARELREKLGVAVRPHEITNMFYRGELSDDLCPIVGGRRLIPRDYLPQIADHLRSRRQTQCGRPNDRHTEGGAIPAKRGAVFLPEETEE